MSTMWLKCARWGLIPAYALWSCRRGAPALCYLNKPLNYNPELSYVSFNFAAETWISATAGILYEAMLVYTPAALWGLIIYL